MKINLSLFLPYIFVWELAGMMVFDAVIPMIAFIFFGGVCGGLILAAVLSNFHSLLLMLEGFFYELFNMLIIQ